MSILAIIAALVLALGGTIEEDSILFDCRIHGNQVCGPAYVAPVDTLGGAL